MQAHTHMGTSQRPCFVWFNNVDHPKEDFSLHISTSSCRKKDPGLTAPWAPFPYFNTYSSLSPEKILQQGSNGAYTGNGPRDRERPR